MRIRTSPTALQILLCGLILLGGQAPATLAQVDTQPITDPEPVIAAETDTQASDSNISSRIQNIFAELTALQAVTVEVKEGVVTLRGDVANEAVALQAQRLAIRLAGVVTVEDEISRTLAVVDNVAPMLSKLRSHVSNFVRALPLIGLALLAVALFSFAGACGTRFAQKTMSLSTTWRALSCGSRPEQRS